MVQHRTEMHRFATGPEKMSRCCVALLLLICHGTWQAAGRQVEVDVEPRQILAEEGNSFEFVCKARQAIDSCTIQAPNGLNFSMVPGVLIGHNFHYVGDGFKEGHCGALFQSSEVSQDGVYTCSMQSNSSSMQFKGTINVTIVHSPSQPELVTLVLPLWHQRDSDESDLLQATCRAQHARPPATFAWYLGDERIQFGVSEAEVTPEPNQLFTVTQNVTRVVSWRDHGKKLRCVANHVTSPRSIEDQLDVRFAPVASAMSPMVQYGFKQGLEGVVTINVSANPQPRIQWHVDEEEIVMGDFNFVYEVEEPKQTSSGVWETRLLIKNVSASDFDKYFKLTASNYLGVRTYEVRISTEPYDVGLLLTLLSFSALVAIAVTVLLVLCCRHKKVLCFKSQGIYVTTEDELQEIPTMDPIILNGTENPVTSTSSEY